MKFLVFLSLLMSTLVLKAQNFDHSHRLWNDILLKYTVKKKSQVLVNYKSLKKNAHELSKYLSQLETLSPKKWDKFSKLEQLAFWINTYNAYTLKIVLDHYPVKSIKEIKSGWFSSGPWRKDFIKLFNKKMSLDDIEHKTIRKQFNEPRIHFAVNCASMGCPSLLQEAFVAQKMNEQLDQAAQNFLNNKDKNEFKNGQLYLSKIFDWYGDDFNKKYGSYKNYVIKVLKLEKKDYDVKFKEYDWNLNKVK